MRNRKTKSLSGRRLHPHVRLSWSSQLYPALVFLVTFLLLVLTAESAFAFGGECRKYLNGTANPEIPKFGGGSKGNPVQEMADVLLEYVPNGKETVQVAVPTNLKFNAVQNRLSRKRWTRQ